MKLSHLDDSNQPAMVNVGGKQATLRTAEAQAVIRLPEKISAAFKDGELTLKKGPVLQTASLAGVMGAKKTSELIPLCHPIGLDDCKVNLHQDQDRIIITTRCEIFHKTGVEMEALTAASVAALTVYDMCKALSHDIVIEDVRLISKTGGKRDFSRDRDA